jgi:hypothetical protein
MEGYCAELLKGSRDKELLKGYVSIMRREAKLAQQRAQNVAGKFRSVSEGLRRVASNAEAETVSSLANAQSSATLIVENQSLREARKKTYSIFTTVLSAGLAFGAAVAGAPVAMAAGGALAIAEGISYAVNKNDEATTDCVHSELVQHTLSELEGAIKFGSIVSGVNLIIAHVDVAVQWWGDMDTELEAIEAKIARLDSQDFSVLYLPYLLLNFWIQLLLSFFYATEPFIEYKG